MLTKQFRATLLAAVMCAASSPAAAQIASYTVSSARELAALLPTLTQTSQVLLAPGNYGDMLIRNMNPAADVVIRSAVLTDKAVIHSLVVRDSSRLRFDQIVFERIRAADEPQWISAVHVQNSNQIRFTRNLFTGTNDGDPNNDGYLLRISGAADTVVVDNMFREGRIGVLASRVVRSIFASNRFDQLREGVNFSSSNDVRIDRNQFTNIFPNVEAGDHADCIQLFQGSDGSVSHNMTIANNAMLVSNSRAQGIFVRNSRDSNLAGFQRFTGLRIENNLYVGNVRNGIAVSDAIAPRLARNSVVSAATPILWPGLIVRDVTDAIVEKNITPMVLAIDATAVLNGNTLTQHPKALGQTPVSQVFVDSTSTAPTPVAFATQAGSSANSVGAGYVPASETGGIPDVETEARYAWYTTNLALLTQPVAP